MQDIKAQILLIVAAMWRRRWYAVAAAWAVCTIGWIYVALLPDVYEAKTRIYVDTDTLLRPLMRGLAADTSSMNEVDLMKRTLLSQPNLVRISRATDQDLAARTSLQQEELVNELRARIRIGDNGRNLFAISYQGSDRAISKRVVEELVNILVETNLGTTRKEITSARTFVDDQIRVYEEQLNAAEERVARFKAENFEILGGSGDGTGASTLEQAKAVYLKTKGELDEAQRRVQELERQLGDVPQFIEVKNSEPTGPLLGGDSPTGSFAGIGSGLQIGELEQKLTELRLRYTSAHPDVIETQRLLAKAKRDLKKQQDQPDESRTITSTISNPVYERLQLQLIDEKGNVATLSARLERNEADLKRWQGRAETIPGVNAELSRLTRDYEVLRRNYTELISRREAAKMGEELETQTKNTQFRLIDPPEVGSIPIGPNRKLYLSFVFIFGIGVGVGFAFLLSQLDESISHVEQMRRVIGRPVLGSVSVLKTSLDLQVRRVGALAYGAAFAALVLAYAGLMAVEALLQHSA